MLKEKVTLTRSFDIDHNYVEHSAVTIIAKNTGSKWKKLTTKCFLSLKL
jgi:hypothetical protein